MNRYISPDEGLLLWWTNATTTQAYIIGSLLLACSFAPALSLSVTV